MMITGFGGGCVGLSSGVPSTWVEGVTLASRSGVAMRVKGDLFETQGTYAVVESIAKMGCEDYGESTRLKYLGLVTFSHISNSGSSILKGNLCQAPAPLSPVVDGLRPSFVMTNMPNAVLLYLFSLESFVSLEILCTRLSFVFPPVALY